MIKYFLNVNIKNDKKSEVTFLDLYSKSELVSII